MNTELLPIKRDLFCSIMRRQAASVTVITTAHDGQIHGMTATAFSSVCADPPTILIAVNRSTRSHPLIDSSGAFVVNMLGHHQHAIAQRFAGKHADQFVDIAYEAGRNGAPILSHAAAHLDCEVVNRLEIETHTLFVARVLAGDVGDVSPLIYHEGAFASVGYSAEQV